MYNLFHKKQSFPFQIMSSWNTALKGWENLGKMEEEFLWKKIIRPLWWVIPSKKNAVLPSKKYKVSQKISVQDPTITRLPEKGVEPEMTQQNMYCKCIVIAIVELASNKIQPVPKKKCTQFKMWWNRMNAKRNSTIAKIGNCYSKQEIKHWNGKF